MLELAYFRLASQVPRLSLHGPVLGGGLDPEAIHQTRITTRRVRAVFRAFKDMLPEESTAALSREFRWLAGVLGDARDLDVYADKLHGYAATLPGRDADALAPYESFLESQRVAARRSSLAALRSDRYSSLARRFGTYLDHVPSPGALRRWGSFRIRDGAPFYVGRAARRMVERGRRIDADSPPEALHRLRIHGKRLRYQLELFRDFYDDRLVKQLKAARGLQDTLGDYQDACIASGRLRAYAATLDAPDQLLALGRLLQNQAQSATASRTAFERAWSGFRKAMSRSWKKGIARR